MGKALLIAVIFVVVGAILWALVVPLLFPNANPEKVGAVSLPLIVLVFGGSGFAVGLYRAKRQG